MFHWLLDLWYTCLSAEAITWWTSATVHYYCLCGSSESYRRFYYHLKASILDPSSEWGVPLWNYPYGVTPCRVSVLRLDACVAHSITPHWEYLQATFGFIYDPVRTEKQQWHLRHSYMGDISEAFLQKRRHLRCLYIEEISEAFLHRGGGWERGG